MKYLTTPNAKGLTPVEVYIEKQAAWTAAQNAWDTAKIEARRSTFPSTACLMLTPS